MVTFSYRRVPPVPTLQLQLFRRQVRALRARLHTCSMFTLNYDLLLAVSWTTSHLATDEPSRFSRGAT